jgi:hypothetical protein
MKEKGLADPSLRHLRFLFKMVYVSFQQSSELSSLKERSIFGTLSLCMAQGKISTAKRILERL